jgi:hypothetical protein
VAFAPTVVHWSVPAGQLAAHAPFAHTSAPGHVGPQLPALQICPAPQDAPQAPQLFGSEVRSTHEVPHAVNVTPPKPQYEQSTPPSCDGEPPHPEAERMPHVWVHAPLWQTCPAEQALPQPPQFAESELVSVQKAVAFAPPPVHACWPAGQLDPQKPFAQNPPPAQSGVHVPPVHV